MRSTWHMHALHRWHLNGMRPWARASRRSHAVCRTTACTQDRVRMRHGVCIWSRMPPALDAACAFRLSRHNARHSVCVCRCRLLVEVRLRLEERVYSVAAHDQREGCNTWMLSTLDSTPTGPEFERGGKRAKWGGLKGVKEAARVYPRWSRTRGTCRTPDGGSFA